MRCLPLPLAILTLSAAPSLRAQGNEESAAERLLRAELLEASVGNLPRAVELYEVIRTDDDAPAAVRARAHFNLARCQRRLGNLEGAETLLAELVEAYPDDTVVTERARSFLRELRRGEAENSDFDWLSQLEHRPEVQARVFDLGMDLVDLESDAGKLAWQQLRALGTIAVPVLERLFESSRDANHRRSLAWILILAGKYERLPEVLNRANSPSGGRSRNLRDRAAWTLLDRLMDADAEERAHVLEVFDAASDEQRDSRLAALVRLAAGDTRDFRATLARAETAGRLSFSRGTHSVVPPLLEEDPSLASVLSDVILEPETPPVVRDRYVGLLERFAPDRLSEAHRRLRLRDDLFTGRHDFDPKREIDFGDLDPPYDAIAALEEKQDFELLADYAAADATHSMLILQYFWLKYGATDRLGEAPEGWAGTLAACSSGYRVAVPPAYRVEEGTTDLDLRTGFEVLHMLAEEQDAALDRLHATLARRGEVCPEYEGRPRRYKPWTPSERFFDAALSWTGSDDVVVRAIGLEALLHAPADARSRVKEVADGILASSGDFYLRQLAIHLLVEQLWELEEERAGLVARIEREHVRTAGIEEPVASPEAAAGWPKTIPLFNPGLGAMGGPRARRMQRDKAAPLLVQERVLRLSDDRIAQALYPHVIAGMDTVEGTRFHLWYTREVYPRVSGVRGAAVLDDERVVAALEETVRNRELDIESRRWALRLLGDRAQASFDIPALLRSDDPLAMDIMRQLEPPELIRHGTESPNDEVRAIAVAAVHMNDLDDLLALLGTAAADPSTRVRSATLDRLLQLNRAEAEPILVRFLSDPSRSIRREAVEHIAAYASLRVAEALVGLLDDPDVRMREQALAALEKVRTRLAQTREWKAFVESLRQTSGREEGRAEEETDG